MPYTLRKVPRKDCYRVKNTKNKRIMSKCTTKAKATKQIRLLRGIMYNKSFAARLRSTRKKRA